MINLAGAGLVPTNKAILRELERVGLTPSFFNEPTTTEVQTTVYAKLNGLTFVRAWTYWVVSGIVPLDAAKALYAGPVGKTDIRVSGHCGCPPPEAPWVDWLDPKTNKQIIPTKNLEQRDQMLRILGEDAMKDFMDSHIFHDDPASLGAFGYITTYHIDTELGLYIFVQAAKALK